MFYKSASPVAAEKRRKKKSQRKKVNVRLLWDFQDILVLAFFPLTVLSSPRFSAAIFVLVLISLPLFFFHLILSQLIIFLFHFLCNPSLQSEVCSCQCYVIQGQKLLHHPPPPLVCRNAQFSFIFCIFTKILGILVQSTVSDKWWRSLGNVLSFIFASTATLHWI